MKSLAPSSQYPLCRIAKLPFAPPVFFSPGCASPACTAWQDPISDYEINRKYRHTQQLMKTMEMLFAMDKFLIYTQRDSLIRNTLWFVSTL